MYCFLPVPFTAPFIFSVWILLGICTWITPDLLLVSETVSDTVREVDYVQAFCLGIGQVMFQENLLTGLFFLAGIGVNSWTGTFYTALGTLLPNSTSFLTRDRCRNIKYGIDGL